MANKLLKNGYQETYILEVIRQLGIYHDVEVLNERHYFKELDWKILIPETNAETRRISLHNFSILKDQIY
jgi:hypothetical protein